MAVLHHFCIWVQYNFQRWIVLSCHVDYEGKKCQQVGSRTRFRTLCLNSVCIGMDGTNSVCVAADGRKKRIFSAFWRETYFEWNHHKFCCRLRSRRRWKQTFPMKEEHLPFRLAALVLIITSHKICGSVKILREWHHSHLYRSVFVFLFLGG